MAELSDARFRNCFRLQSYRTMISDVFYELINGRHCTDHRVITSLRSEVACPEKQRSNGRVEQVDTGLHLCCVALSLSVRILI